MEKYCGRHGGVRGAEVTCGSQSFEGRFGRLFRTLPAARHNPTDLSKLAAAMLADAEDIPTPESEIDDEENRGISAGYTYLGQFIDHDLTFDPASSLQKQNDPDALTDFRTPAFDLDNLYGRGPDDQPYLYEDDGLRFALGKKLTGNADDPGSHDLPRHQASADGRARALIGDPRNDENTIVSQIQGIMLRFHNSLVAHMTTADGKKPAFADVQQQVRWHYQWMIVNDFLPTMVGSDMVAKVMPQLNMPRLTGNGQREDDCHDDNINMKSGLRFFKWRNAPFIPIEFSTAAYRFGHSMVRPIYRLNVNLLRRAPTSPDPIKEAALAAVNGRQLIFSRDDSFAVLNGFRDFPSSWAIDWSLFFNMGNNPPSVGLNRLQHAYKIDTSLVNPLGNLPTQIAKEMPSLAERNLLRGLRMGLPSGQDVARFMGITPLKDEDLWVGKATEEVKAGKKRIPLTQVSPSFANNAPLWFYVLAEAQQQFINNDTPIRLGPVGGRIVCETFIGLLLGDSHSYLSQDPKWRPDPAFAPDGKFGIVELIKQAIKGG